MTADVPLDRVLASVRSTSDRPIPHPRQEPTMTAPRPSPAGLSPLLDQLDEARAKGTPGPWWASPNFVGGYSLEIFDVNGLAVRRASGLTEPDAALIVAAVNALPQLTAAVREVLALADELEGYARTDRDTVLWVTDALRSAVTAALTPGADTAGATA